MKADDGYVLPYEDGGAVDDDVLADPQGAALTSFLEGVFLDRDRTAYLSTPVTTGRWFYEELANRGARGQVRLTAAELVREVKGEAMRLNAAASDRAIRQLLTDLPEYNIINPATLQASWSQRQFLTFWLRIINRYVGTLIVADDWEYSTGSSYECLTALKLGIPVLTLSLSPVSALEAGEAVQGALDELASLGLAVGELEEVARQFETLAHSLGGAVETQG